MNLFEDRLAEMLRDRATEAAGASIPAGYLTSIRRRRARNAGAALASFVLVALAAYAAIASRPDGGAIVGPRPTPTPAPFHYQMLDVYGVDRTRVFVLTGGACNATGCNPGLMMTSDAGRTWIRRATPPGVRTPSGVPAFHDGFFASSERGWLFGVQAWETRNGGLSWHTRPELRGVQTIERGSDALWASITKCASPPCHSSILRSTDQGVTWTKNDIPGFRVGRILAINNSAAWIVQTPSDGKDYALRRTIDGGRTWTPHAMPPAQCDRTSVIFGTTTTLVSVCGGEPATAIQLKTVWALVHDSSGALIWELMSSRPGNSRLPDTGHISRMYSAPGGKLWLWLDRGGFYSTADNGASWNHEIGEDGDPFILGASFPVAGSAWAVFSDNSLWRSSTGEIKGWQRLDFPDSTRAEIDAMPICTVEPSPHNRPPTAEEYDYPAVCKADPSKVRSIPCGPPSEVPCPGPPNDPASR